MHFFKNTTDICFFWVKNSQIQKKIIGRIGRQGGYNYPHFGGQNGFRRVMQGVYLNNCDKYYNIII